MSPTSLHHATETPSASDSLLYKTAETLHSLENWVDNGACTTITAKQAIQQAGESELRRSTGQSLGPVDGLHVVWKDIFDQVGEITTCGSDLLKNKDPAVDNSVCVGQLAEAGTISLARTGLSEFAFSGLGINPHFGTPPSALSTSDPFLPGGSTSGAAVLVAHGLADLGMGTDTSGSIRVPAALNGIFGFRPSANRYDRSGIHSLSETLDTVGTLAQSLEVLKATDTVLSKQRQRKYGSAKADILDLSESLGPSWSCNVANAYATGLERLSAAGWAVQKTRLKAVDELTDFIRSEGPLVAIEARRKYEALLQNDDAQIDPMIRIRLAQAPIVNEAQYTRYLAKRTQLISKAKSEVGDRLVAYPTVPSLRHPLAEYLHDTQAQLDLNARLLEATMVGSNLDWPGLAVPLRDNRGVVQSSMLLSAAQNNDDFLLAQASMIVPEVS